MVFIHAKMLLFQRHPQAQGAVWCLRPYGQPHVSADPGLPGSPLHSGVCPSWTSCLPSSPSAYPPASLRHAGEGSWRNPGSSHLEVRITGTVTENAIFCLGYRGLITCPRLGDMQLVTRTESQVSRPVQHSHCRGRAGPPLDSQSSAVAAQGSLANARGIRKAVTQTSCPSPRAAAGWDETMHVRCTCHVQSQHCGSWAPLAIVISCLVTLSSTTTAFSEPRAGILFPVEGCVLDPEGPAG